MSNEVTPPVEGTPNNTPSGDTSNGAQPPPVPLGAQEGQPALLSDEQLGNDSEEEEQTKNQDPKKHEKGDNPSPKQPPRADSYEAGFFKAWYDAFGGSFSGLGDKVGRDQFSAEEGNMFIGSTIHYHPGASPTSQTPSASDPGFEITVDYEALLATFVAPNESENALQLLQQHGALIISGMPGNGRRTLGHYLLHRLEFSQQIEFRQLSNATSLLELDDQAFAQVMTHRAYLLGIDPSGASSGKELSQKKVEQLVGRVCQKHSYLIMIWQEALTLPFKVPWHIHLALHELPQRTVVFQKHVKYLLETYQISVPTQKMKALFNDSEIRYLLTDAQNLKRVTAWAAFVVSLLKEGHSVKQIVQECQQQQAFWLRRDALKLIESAPSMAHLCLRIAAAVMSNIHADAFKELAYFLQKVLDNSFDRKSRKNWQQFWNGPRSQWLEAAHAKVKPMTEWIRGRRVRRDVMVTTPEMLSLPLVEAFWEQYSQHRSAFLVWLKLCGQHQNFHIRFAAARAISVLSLRDPHSIEKDIIMPWAKTRDIAVQETAAMSFALSFAQSESTAQAIRIQLEKWSDMRDEKGEIRPEPLFASAIIYAWLGIHSPKEFIEGIDRLVTRRDRALLVIKETEEEITVGITHTKEWRLSAVRFAFQRFLQLSELEPDDEIMLLKRILKWAQSNSRGQRRIARTLFVDLMLVDEALNVQAWQKQEGQSTLTTWPVLLRITERTNEARFVAARLFEHATASRGTWLACWGGLKRMVIFAGKEQKARPFLKRFIYVVVARSKRPATARELKRRLQHWAKTSQKAANPAPYSQDLLAWLRKNKLL